MATTHYLVKERLHCIAISSDGLHIAVGTNSGFQVFRTAAPDNAKRIFFNTLGTVSLIAMGYESRHVFVVNNTKQAGSMNTVYKMDGNKNIPLASYICESAILAIKVKPPVIALVTTTSIYDNILLKGREYGTNNCNLESKRWRN